MKIRTAKRKDAVTLARAEAETARSPGLLVQKPGEIPTEAFATKIESLKKRGRYVVAEENGKAIGHAFLDPMGLTANRHVFHLNIVVHPEFKGRGIGTALMSDLISWAQTGAKVGKIELLVRSTNTRAIALYRRFGFTQEGRLVGRVKLPNGKLIDDLVMGWFPKRARRPN
ncbi:MAG: GNAT family N-acetyltransferase [Elusimicrobiota bacterium]|nr:MAG: GNAT family N-acetyltransferase [Elusimicrobiota bacterium]